MTVEFEHLVVDRQRAQTGPAASSMGAQQNFKAFRSKARGQHSGAAPCTQVVCVQESELTQVQITQRKQAARCATPRHLRSQHHRARARPQRVPIGCRLHTRQNDNAW